MHVVSILLFSSTASSALNAIALVCLEDIVKKRKKDITDNDAAKVCKIICEYFTAICSYRYNSKLVHFKHLKQIKENRAVTSGVMLEKARSASRRRTRGQ